MPVGGGTLHEGQPCHRAAWRLSSRPGRACRRAAATAYPRNGAPAPCVFSVLGVHQPHVARHVCAAAQAWSARQRRASAGRRLFGTACRATEPDTAAAAPANPLSALLRLVVRGEETVVLGEAAAVGLLTGVAVVLLNDGIHATHDLTWGSFGLSGAAVDPGSRWPVVLLLPAAAGTAVSVLRSLVGGFDALPDTSDTPLQVRGRFYTRGVYLMSYRIASPCHAANAWTETSQLTAQALVRPVAKAGAAALTLGCGVPLGPEGPSVQLGSGVAAGLQRLSPSSEQRRLSLLAAGSAAGLSAGFGATLAGAFFAVEAVLQPSSAAGRPSDPPSLTASMVLIAAVLASVVSRAGLGAEPTFVVPAYDVSPLGELPLFLGLGAACGGISLAFAFTTTLAERAVQGLTARGVSPSLLPPLAGLLAGGVALAYPETLYNGFSNVDTILAAPRSLYPPALLMTLVAAKVGATSVCRASGLVGGVYAPSLFMGAALGAAYGAAASQLPFAAALGFGSPAAYALVGMAATLAAVCRVPLTAILLMFEYTQDFRMLLPLMASVGVAAWVASVADERALASTGGGGSTGRSGGTSGALSAGRGFGTSPTSGTLQPIDEDADAAMAKRAASTMGAVFDDRDLSEELGRDQLIARVLRELPVSVAMRTQFLTLASDASLVMAAAAMVGAREKVAVLRSPEDQAVIGVLTHDAVQRALDAAALVAPVPGAAGGESAATAPGGAAKACANAGGSFQGTRAAWSRITPDTPLADALAALTRGGLRQLPVVPVVNVQRPPAVGLLEAEAVADACAMELTQRALRRAARMQQKQEESERGSQAQAGQDSK